METILNLLVASIFLLCLLPGLYSIYRASKIKHDHRHPVHRARHHLGDFIKDMDEFDLREHLKL